MLSLHFAFWKNTELFGSCLSITSLIPETSDIPVKREKNCPQRWALGVHRANRILAEDRSYLSSRL